MGYNDAHLNQLLSASFHKDKASTRSGHELVFSLHNCLLDTLGALS